MKKKGLDPENEDDLWAQSLDVMNHYFDEMEKVVHEISPSTVIFKTAAGLKSALAVKSIAVSS